MRYRREGGMRINDAKEKERGRESKPDSMLRLVLVV